MHERHKWPKCGNRPFVWAVQSPSTRGEETPLSRGYDYCLIHYGSLLSFPSPLDIHWTVQLPFLHPTGAFESITKPLRLAFHSFVPVELVI